MRRNPGSLGKLLLIASIAAFGFALAARPALADNEGAFKYRQAIMRAMAGHMGAAAAIIKGQVDHKSQLPAHADALAALGKMVKDIFPKGSDVADSAALPAIWEKPAEFATAAAALESATAKFATMAAGGTMQETTAAFVAVGKSCGGCHENFRRKR